MGRDIGLLPSTLWLQIAVLVCASVLIRSDPSPLLPLVWNRIYMHLPQLPHRKAGIFLWDPGLESSWEGWVDPLEGTATRGNLAL